MLAIFERTQNITLSTPFGGESLYSENSAIHVDVVLSHCYARPARSGELRRDPLRHSCRNCSTQIPTWASIGAARGVVMASESIRALAPTLIIECAYPLKALAPISAQPEPFAHSKRLPRRRWPTSETSAARAKRHFTVLALLVHADP